MDSYTTIEKYAKHEYEDRRSVFIGEALPVNNEPDALAFIADVKKRYSDAKHHVYAYILRENSIMRFTDDREPQGTAGAPILDMMRKRSCTDIVIVVTRYFGGVLLGTGGLVKAYTTAAQGALEAANVITYNTYLNLNINASYSDYQRIIPILSSYGFRQTDVRYSDNVLITGRVIKDSSPEFQNDLVQSTGGRITFKINGEIYDY